MPQYIVNTYKRSGDQYMVLPFGYAGSSPHGNTYYDDGPINGPFSDLMQNNMIQSYSVDWVNATV